jgi:hypothetical protein
MTDLPEAMVLQAADEILRAAGSGMRFYSMPSTRERILRATERAMQESLTAAGVAEMREALEKARAWFEAAGTNDLSEAGADWLNDGGWDLEAPPVLAAITAALQGSSHE